MAYGLSRRNELGTKHKGEECRLGSKEWVQRLPTCAVASHYGVALHVAKIKGHGGLHV